MAIKTKLSIDGEAEYRRQITNITTAAKSLDAQMKAVTSSFDKNTSAEEKAAKQTEILTQKQAAQQRAVELYKSQLEQANAELQEYAAKLEEATQSEGENSEAAQKARKNLEQYQAEVDKLKTNLANAETELNKTSSAIEEVGNEEDKASESTSRFGDVLKANLISEAVVAGVKALSSAMKEVAKAAFEFGKEVVTSYADFEQLEGGVKKIFGDDYQAVLDNAAEAFKTVGISANEYMETVTSFSASLISSLGGDTAKATEVADLALRDMADNANTYGTDLSSIQNAYQGFAKQTYTMLDNLKLGYGGTKSEMERLLKDANEYNKQMGRNTDYQLENYADIIMAIHDIQEQQGIMGTTEAEAAKTVSGSINTMKAAYKNFVTELGKSNANIDTAFNNLKTSFENVVTNIQPIIQRLIDYIPQISALIIPAISGMVPDLVAGIGEMLAQLVAALIPVLPVLIPAVVEAVSTICDALIDNIDMLVEASIDLILALNNGMITALPKLIAAVPKIIKAFVDAIVAKLPDIIQTGVGLVQAFIEGIIQSIGAVLESVAQIGRGIYESLGTLANGAYSWGQDMITNFANGITNAMYNLLNTVINLANRIRSYLHFSEPDKGPLSDFNTYAPDMMKTFAKGVIDNTYRVENAVSYAAGAMSNAMGGASATPTVQATVDRGSIAALSSGPNNITIEFTGNLAQLGRILQPVIAEEGNRRGISLVNA